MEQATVSSQAYESTQKGEKSNNTISSQDFAEEEDDNPDDEDDYLSDLTTGSNHPSPRTHMYTNKLI